MGDFLRGEAAHLAQRERDLRLGRERRMAAGENEAQPVIGPCLPRRTSPATGGLALHDQDAPREASKPNAPAQDTSMALNRAGRDEPRARIQRARLHSANAPARRRRPPAAHPPPGRKIPQQPDERGQHAPRFLAVDRGDGTIAGMPEWRTTEHWLTAGMQATRRVHRELASRLRPGRAEIQHRPHLDAVATGRRACGRRVAIASLRSRASIR